MSLIKVVLNCSFTDPLRPVCLLWIEIENLASRFLPAVLLRHNRFAKWLTASNDLSLLTMYFRAAKTRDHPLLSQQFQCVLTIWAYVVPCLLYNLRSGDKLLVSFWEICRGTFWSIYVRRAPVSTERSEEGLCYLSTHRSSMEWALIVRWPKSSCARLFPHLLMVELYSFRFSR